MQPSRGGRPASGTNGTNDELLDGPAIGEASRRRLQGRGEARGTTGQAGAAMRAATRPERRAEVAEEAAVEAAAETVGADGVEGAAADRLARRTL